MHESVPQILQESRQVVGMVDDDEIVPLPCLVLPKDMQAILQGKTKHACCRIVAWMDVHTASMFL